VFKFLYGIILLYDFTITILLLNLLINFFDLIKGSLGPLLKHRSFLMIIFYIFGRLFLVFSKSDSTDYFKAQKLSIGCKKFPGPFEHTFLYQRIYKQIDLMRNWLRNILAIVFIGKAITENIFNNQLDSRSFTNSIQHISLCSQSSFYSFALACSHH
jgi:hypothetical protein